MSITRREFNKASTVALSSSLLPAGRQTRQGEDNSFQLKYILASCMYGVAPITDILPEVRKTGAIAIDLWPRPHGDQRNQLTKIGEKHFAALLAQYRLPIGCITQYPLGPFGLREEMQLCQRMKCKQIVCGGKGPTGLKGSELKAAIKVFVELMQPHLEMAEKTGVTIAIENHSNNLIMSPDSLKWLIELCPNKHLGIALAPYHLEQDAGAIAKLILELGNRISVFYAWQHGKGCMKKLPKADELLQMPGRGDLDFIPILGALKKIEFNGWTEIFMHPVPRGIPILETTQMVTDEINRARGYLTECLAKI